MAKITETQKILAAFKKPDHSDWLIHWTGYDIDHDYDCDWWRPRKNTVLNRSIVQPYLERLKWTLRYGLWMLPDTDPIRLVNDNTGRSQRYKRPPVWRTCFTELKLSEAQTHALRFGRLGIGFKRMFVFDRLGLPMIYYRPEKMNWPFLCGAPKSRKFTEFSACYLKSMAEKNSRKSYRHYEQFEESEWRIIYSPEIEKKLASNDKTKGLNRYFLKPTDITDVSYHKYVNRQKKQPGYLIPLSEKDIDPNGSHMCQWLAIIIYPSLAVKVAAEADIEIRWEIEEKKPTPKLGNLLGPLSSSQYECCSKPIEIDLSACNQI